MAVALGLAACKTDETIVAYGVNKVWHLVEIDNRPFDAQASFKFSKDGQVHGRGPCNQFTTNQTKPYPWIGFGPIASTRMMCEKMQEETAFFQGLGAMTEAEISGEVMLLSNEDGRQMLFKAVSDDD